MVGTPLFRRLPRGVEPTAAGLVAGGEGAADPRRYGRALDAARRTARGEEGRLALGFTSSAAFHALVRRWCAPCGGAPHPLPFAGGGKHAGTHRGAAGRASRCRLRPCAGGAAGRHSSSPMCWMKRCSWRCPTITVSRHRPPPSGAGTRRIGGGHFSSIGAPSGPGLYDSIIAACQQAGFSPRVGQEAPRLASTLSLVAAGLGSRSCRPPWRGWRRTASSIAVWRRRSACSRPFTQPRLS